MIHLRLAAERGQTRISWLDSRHSFSFGSYYDPRYRGFSDLLVINDDRVKAGAGFSTHSHRDMEIISYVLEGTIEHRDSMGQHTRLRAGEVQVMSAGTGISHSEYNASDTEALRFLQIWILPDRAGYEPRYAQQDYSTADGITLVVAPDGREGSLPIRQQACIYQLKLVDQTETLPTADDRAYYLQVAEGSLRLNGHSLQEGDGAAIWDEPQIKIEAKEPVRALLMELRK